MRRRMMMVAVLAASAIFAAGCGGGDAAPVPPSPAGDAVVSVTPANGATGIPVTQVITVAFSKDLDETTLTAATITLTRANGLISVPGAIAYDAAGKTLTFTPTHPMLSGGLYAFTITSAAMTKAAGDYAVTFTTQATPMLVGSTMDPANPAAAVTAINVWSMNPDGTGLKALTTFPDKAHGSLVGPVAWSPDDTRIAFIAEKNDPSDRADVFIMNADGTGLLNLTNGAANYEAQNLKWSPDGTRIFFLFTPDSTADHSDLAAVHPDGTGLVNLTNFPATLSPFSPLFEVSPDGSKLFVAVRTLPGSVPGNLYAVNTDGSGVTKLTNAAATDLVVYPLLTPDGTKLYYASGSPATGFGVFAMNIDGTGVQTIVAQAVNQMFAPWSFSPDGSRFLTLYEDPTGANAYVVLADGSQAPTALATISGTNVATISNWSPDGSKISYLYGDSTAGPVDLFVANRDGTGSVNLSHCPVGTLATDGRLWMVGLGAGLWSPDGTQIAFTERIKATDAMNVSLANADGSGTAAITNLALPLFAAVAAWW